MKIVGWIIITLALLALHPVIGFIWLGLTFMYLGAEN